LTVAEKNDLEKLEVYTDRFPLLKLRKQIRKVLILINMVAYAIINTKLFENISITVIMINSIVMIFDDPTEEPTELSKTLENVFLALYTIEMVLSIVGKGFFFSEGAYIKDGWNILDFVIVMVSYFTLFTTEDVPKTTAAN
jgi:hypothetical protein